MRTKHLFVSIALSVLASVDLHAVQWTTKAFFPGGACQDGIGFAVNGKGYMGLGVIGGPTYSKSIWAYDPGLDAWSQQANFGGGPRWYATGFTIGNKGYAGAGLDSLGSFVNDWWEYDPTANTWTAKANYPGGGRVGMTTFEINGKGYMGMGANTFTGTYFTDIWEFDPTLNSWSAKAPVGGAPRGGAQGFANGNYGYCALGADGTTYYTDMWRYDATADAWQAASSFPGVGRSNFRNFMMGAPPYLGMGRYGSAQLQYVLVQGGYNTGFDTWTAYPVPPIQGAGGGSFAIGTRGYVRDPGFSFLEFNPFDCLNVLNGPDLPGAPCDDNNPCTTSDTWSPACVCTGTFQDSDGDGFADICDNCPFTPGQIGDPCNDNNPGTINDVVNGSCVCVGTCTGNTVTLTLNTDANAAQTSWDIVITSTNNVVCSGSGYTNNSTIPVTCCLPNGCYDLRVFDSFGDGINPGGHVLRDAANNRIIDNFGNGSTFTSTSMSALGFCVPLGSGTLHPASCDVMTATPTTVLHANLDPAVTSLYSISTPTVNANTGYQFWITNPNGGFSRRILFTHAAPGTGWPIATPTAQKASYFRLNAMSSPPTVPLGVLLNVRVRSLLNGTYGVFGPACRLYLPVPPCQLSQLTTTASPVISCGATGLSLTNTIYATTVPSATHYQFEFSKNAYLRKITVPTNSVALSFVTNPLQNNNCYDVRVRASMDGGLTYCPFGPVCTITIGVAICGNAIALEPGDGTLEPDARLSVWPNPNHGEQLTLALVGLDANADHIDMTIFDAFGKEVMAHTYPVSGGEVNTTIDSDHALAAGVYVVRVSADEQRFTERLIIE